MPARPVAALALAAALLAGCGDDDDAGPAPGAGDLQSGADELAVPDITGCTFEPADAGTADLATGTVTVRGENTTGEVIDTTTIRYSIDGVEDDLALNISFWQPGEEVAMVGSVFADGGDLVAGDCTDLEVLPGAYGEMTEFDASAATCEVVRDEASRLEDVRAAVDVSDVGDRPEAEQLFATVAIRDGDVRVTEQFPYVEPGESTAEALLFSDGDDLSCEVMNLRLP